ncbi:MAG: right-handed parallel beta-helix repeat-containing protein [bacterium]
MKSIVKHLCLGFIVLIVFSYTSLYSQINLYVSINGSDTWSGRLPSANQTQTDGPFASFKRAQYEIRRLRTSGEWQQGGKTIFVREGTYKFKTSLKLEAGDSGEQNAPIIWRTYKNERVVLTGNTAVSSFKPISDPVLLKRINHSFHSSILVADLKEQGITGYGTITQRGGPGLEVFFRGERMTLARWPDTGWLRIADVPQSGDSLYNKGLDREKRFNNVPVGRHYGRIAYEGSRPERWSAVSEIYLHGLWTWDWSDSYQQVQSIDTQKKEITLAKPHHHYGYTKNQRYYYLNILEELDAPGEWYLDKKNGKLYFWPPSLIQRGDVTVSLLEEPLIILENTKHVQFQGFTLEQSRGQGIVIREGTRNLIAGCTLRQLGNEAVTIDKGMENTIQSCDISDVAMSGIRLNGGDRKTLTPAHHVAINNHIHHYSQWISTGQYAIFIDGVGHNVQHNLIHDAPHEGIYLRGNDHLIEFNDVSRVCQETGDAGALHTGRDWTWRGNIIRYNYFHHLLGPGLHGVMAVYLDDWACGFTVYGNVFYKSGRSAMIGGGRDNIIENNIFVECQPSVHVDARGLGWASYFMDGTLPLLFEQMKEMRYNEPPYSTRYPELLRMYDGETAVPKNNKILRNVSYGGRWLDIYDYSAFDFSVVTMKDNLVADSAICRRRPKDAKGWDPYYLDIDGKEGYVLLSRNDKEVAKEFPGNSFIPGDPGFVDVRKEDFRLGEDSPAFKLGFKQIPVEQIGLIQDEFRTSVARKK